MIERRDSSEIMAKAERLEKSLGDNPADVLYSQEWEKVRSYVETVIEMENNSYDFLYSLAGHKGETIESLRKMTVSEIFNFAERVQNG